MTDAHAGTIAAAPARDRHDVLRPLPRRARLTTHDRPENYTLKVQRVRKPAISALQVARRALTWIVAGITLGVRLAWQREPGVTPARNRGIHLRRFFEQVGGTGIKAGQQLASRVDMLDFDVCRELSLLVDRVPPFPFEFAKQKIEHAVRAPLTDVFESIDPAPIGAASIACVYRGTLQTGACVAIKVQRPGVAEQFAADVACIGVFTQLLELLTVVRPGYFKHLRSELEHMFYQELDFVQEARYQALFRRECRRADIGWLSAPRVHHDISTMDVLISEFVDGIPCSDIVRAVETGDGATLAQLADLDIDPRVIGQRVMYQAWWRRYEESFFHADPHPANVIIRPGNEIVMIDFGSCGITTARNRRNDLAYVRYALRDDVSAMVEIALNNAMASLPPIDVEEFRSRLERYLWQNRFAQISKDAQWWERNSAGIFLGLARANRDLHIPMVPNMLEIMRATMLYDTLALRLYPGFNLNSMFRGYVRKAAQRAARRERRTRRAGGRSRTTTRVAAEGARLRDTLQWGEYWLDAVTENMPVNFQLLSGKSSYVFSVFLRLAVAGTGVIGVAAGSLWLAGAVPAGLSVVELVARAARHPLVLGALALLGLQALRRVAYRLADPDPNG